MQTIQTDLIVTGLNSLYWKGVKLENVSSFNIFSHKGKANCTLVVTCDFPDELITEIEAIGVDIRKGRNK